MTSHLFKVGAGILAVIATLIISYYALQGTVHTDKNSYQLFAVFDNIQGLSKDKEVQLSGVVIGSVENVSLREDGRAHLTLRISNKYKILRNSTFSVNAIPLKDEILSIEKPEVVEKPYSYYEPGETIENTLSPATLSDLGTQAEMALSQINDILSEVKMVVADDRLKSNILQTSENIALATEEAYAFVNMLRETGLANRDQIEATIENIRLLTENLTRTAESLDLLISNANKTVEGANEIVQDEKLQQEIKDIVSILKISMDNIEKTTAAIKDLATDPQVNEDLRQSIKSTRSTMEHADKAVGSFTRMLNAINKTEFKPDFEFRYHAKEDLYHADMNVRIIPPSSDVFYLFGFDNLGEDKTTNLQFGVKGEVPNLWYRFGLKGGHLGLGAEYLLNDYIYYGTLSDPNDLRLGLRIGKRVNHNLFFMAGWEGAFKDDGLSIGFMQRH